MKIFVIIFSVRIFVINSSRIRTKFEICISSFFIKDFGRVVANSSYHLTISVNQTFAVGTAL